jgi:hypothetical protein
VMVNVDDRTNGGHGDSPSPAGAAVGTPRR